jgi:monoamine oxidase
MEPDFLVNSPQPWTPQNQVQAADRKILVVGAGLAGLVVAYRLRQAGLWTDVIEARDRIGGRVHTLRDACGTKIPAELGGEAIDSDHQHLLGLARELGLLILDVQAAVPPGFQDSYWFNGQPVDRASLVAEFDQIAPRLAADIAKLQGFLRSHPPNPDPATQALDQLSIPAYLTHINAPPLIQQVITAAYTTKYACDAVTQSCLNFLSVTDPALGQFRLFGLSDERFYIQGGNDQIPTQLAAAVADQIALSTQLEALTQLDDGRYRVSLRQGQTSCDRSYDQVVITIPFNLLRHIPLNVELPPKQRAAIDHLGYGRPTKVITAYRSKPWHRQGSTGQLFTDLSLEHLWETSQSVCSTKTSLLTNYLSDQHSSLPHPPDLARYGETLAQQLDPVYPGLAAAQITGEDAIARSTWLEDPYSQSGYSCYQIGQWTQFYGSEGQCTDTLFFAGEHCSRQHQGYMEGACETGARAAAAILETCQSTRTAASKT